MWAWGLDSVHKAEEVALWGLSWYSGLLATRGSASPWVTPHHTECKGASIKGFATNISWRKWASSKGLKVHWEFKKWSYNTSVPNLLKPLVQGPQTTSVKGQRVNVSALHAMWSLQQLNSIVKARARVSCVPVKPWPWAWAGPMGNAASGVQICSSPASLSYGSGKRSFSYGFRGGQHSQAPQEPTSRYGQPSEIDGCSKLGRVSFREALSPQLQGQAVLHQPEGWGGSQRPDNQWAFSSMMQCFRYRTSLATWLSTNSPRFRGMKSVESRIFSQ